MSFFRPKRVSELPSTTRVKWNLHTFSWFGLCCTMGYAGSVQSNGAAYLLAFMTGALGVMSYVYARANLRGLEVRVGEQPLFHTGQGELLPVELRAASGHTPCGIEVLLAGASKAAFVDQVPAGQTVRLQLRLPPAGQPVRLMLRSAYPLGLLQAQRVVNVEMTRHAVPPAAGNLPLPSSTVEAAGVDGRSRTSSPPGREGDDFAGVREWHPGDSPKHVDWRAVARGRPMMVKMWSRGASEAVMMDWAAIPLPEGERVGQLVRWIQMSEQQGLSYGIRLPGQEILAGQGEAHARRCLAALAEVHAGGLAGTETGKPVRIAPSHEHRAGVPRGPLVLLSAVLFLTVLPLHEVVAAPVLIFLFLCLAYRSLMKGPVKQRWLPLTMTAVGVVGVYLSQGDLLAMEAGMALLIVLAGGKLLESRSPHDFQVIAMIGWFLCLCGLLADQSILSAVMMFSAYVLIAGCMVRFRRGVPGAKTPAWLTGRLILQALPLVLLLFILFPRMNLDPFRMGARRTAMTGVPSSLDPGNVLEVAKSNEKAFRVEFPDGEIPRNDQRYWRCVVLWNCQGLSWSRGLRTTYAPGLRERQEGDIRQIITLEPHGQIWLPALDFPLRGSDGKSVYPLFAERVLNAHDTVRKLRRFDAVSRPQMDWEPITYAQREAALQLPGGLGEDLQKLAAQWRATSPTDRDVVEAGLTHLRTQGYSYTLEPGTYLGRRALEEFFLRRRQGFCEHFAAAFATMMRAAGVPSRVVMGYQGGEVPYMGTHLIVRQSDAHSWTEVWLEGSGWTRVDPTAALAPGRVNRGLQSFMLGGDEELERQRNSWWWQARERAQVVMDQVNDQWYNWVVSFDEETQFGWWSRLGVIFLGGDGAKNIYLFLVSFFLVVLGLGLLNAWLRRPARDGDPWRRAWVRLCQRLESLGLPVRRPNEGPLAYGRRISAVRPGIEELAAQYAAARYGTAAVSLKTFNKAVRMLR
ncbi:transglutaminaseTgpA domain-containing protein [Prosthecobacter sp. SYSU 5D2]